jgi:hypothetical protein
LKRRLREARRHKLHYLPYYFLQVRSDMLRYKLSDYEQTLAQGCVPATWPRALAVHALRLPSSPWWTRRAR